MKSKFLVLLPLLSVYTITAQLVVTPGAQFSIGGNMQLTLQNTDLINNGNFTTGSGTTSFTGDASSSINGSQPVQFNELEINKTNNSSVLLQRAIGVTQRILFSSGFLNLNGFNADLGTTGHLDGEQENSRITGPNGGEVIFNVNLNSPTGSNPANLGLFITSNQNLGNVTIRRGHQSQVNGAGLGSSILRYYDIIPANNANPDAKLRFRYLDGELNGLNENSIVFFESQNIVNWKNLGFVSRDVAANFVEQTGISRFGRFTLSTAGDVLPVRLILFNAACEGSKVLLTWKTVQEQNSSHFNIERSLDGIRWTMIGSLSAAGNSSSERRYSFTDDSPAQKGYYRIAEYDLDGGVQYSIVLPLSCTRADEVFSLWPNPAHDRVFINIVTGGESQSLIKLFDSKGALVKIISAKVLPGSNQLSIDIGSLANGVYQLSVGWNNGQTKKTMHVLKQ